MLQCSIACLRHSAHIIDTVANFHWLHASEQIQFKLAVGACLLSTSWNCTATSVLATVSCCWQCTQLFCVTLALLITAACMLQRSIAGLCCSAHIIDTVASFRWLHASEQIQMMMKLAVIVYWTLNATSVQPTVRVADWQAINKRVRSSPSNQSSWHSSITSPHCRRPVICYSRIRALGVFLTTSQRLHCCHCSIINWDVLVSTVIPRHCYCTIVVDWHFSVT